MAYLGSLTLYFASQYLPPPFPLPPHEKLEKLEIFQFAPTKPEFRQLEKTRKKLEIFCMDSLGSLTLYFAS